MATKTQRMKKVGKQMAKGTGRVATLDWLTIRP